MAGELNYKAGIDISTFTKTRDQIKKDLADLAKAGAAVGGAINPNTQGINAFRQAQLQMQGSLRDARLETERLKTEQQALRNELAQGRISQQNYRTEVARLAAEQAALRAATTAARNAQTAASGSYREAQNRLRDLGNEIRNTTGGFNAQGAAQRARIEEYRRLNAELTAFDRAMGNNQRNVGNYQSALQGVGKNLVGLAAGFLTAQAALGALTSVIRTNAEISDSLSNVQRTAGLTAKEAENLAEQLKKIDTRTSLKGLLDIATIGGQLGIASSQLGGFTKAIDQLAVTLTGELEGGAEGVAKSLGVLDNVFKVTQANGGDVEKSFNQIGSAILGLGQSGLATGDFLADFGERVGGVAKQAGLSLPVILSYGAVLQENGVSAEVAGTSFKKLISLMATKREAFFAVAQIADSNLTLQEFTDTINTDTQKALELFFNGLQKGGTKTTAFLDILKSSGLAMSGVSQSVAALSANQESLNSHIIDATRDFNEATKSAEQFAIKNDNLAASIEKFNNTVGNSVSDGGLSTFFKQGIDGAREFVVYLDKLVNSQSWREFGVRLRGGDASSFDKANSLKAGLEKNSAVAFNNSNNPNLYKEDAAALKKAFSETKTAAIDATVKYNTFKNAIITGTLKDDGSLKNYKENADILVKQANNLARAYEVARDKAIKNRKPATETDVVLPTDAKTAKAAKRAAEAEAKAQESALKKQRTLQAEIDALTRKGVASKEAADQQEIVSVEEKYRKLREKAIAFNNAKDSKGQKVNISGLSAAEAEEKQEIRYKAEAKVLKSSLDEQAKYFAEFEDLKTKIGEDKAKDRYANLIDVDRTYLESLEKQMEDLTNPGKAKGGSEDEAEANPFAMKLLNEQIAAARIVEQKAQDDLLADFLSYQEKRKVLTERYNKQMLLLGDDAESKALRTEQYQTELDALDDANAKKLDAYKALFEGVDRLSDENARKVVSDAEDMLNALMASGKISKELAKEIRTLLGNTKREITERMPERIINLANQIDRVAEAVSDVDEGFGKLLGTVGNVVGQVGNIKKGMLELKDAQGAGDTLGQLSAGLGIFGAAFSAFKSISNVLGADLRANAEQQSYARDLQNKQIEAINKALERQISLINEAYGTDRIKEYTAALAQADADQKKFQEQLKDRYVLSGDKNTDDVIKLFNSGGTLPGFSRDFMKKSFAAMGLNTLPENLDELQRLLDQGKLDEQTALIVNNLIASAEAAKELANNLKAETIGSSLDNIADDFISALTDGTQDFGKTFEDTIRKSILNGFKGKLIQQQLQGFYDDFAKATSDNNLSEGEIEALRKTYLAASEKAKKDLEALATATGIDLSGKADEKNKPTGITAEIPDKITQQQAGELTGLFRAQYDITKQIAGYTLDGNKVRFDAFNIAREHLDVAIRTEQNTYRTADNTERLAAIESSLKAIANNTNPGQSYRSLLG